MKCHSCSRDAEEGRTRCAYHLEYERELARKCREANPEKARESSRKWREANREKCREDDRRRRKENPEKVHEKERKWKKAHREPINITARAWRKANPEKCRGYKNKWRAENPEKHKAQVHTRRARKNGNGGTFTFKELNELFERQEGFCFYCGELLYSSFDKEVHIEHKTPISRGGTNDISNIALSCARCNLQKGTMTHEEFLQTR